MFKVDFMFNLFWKYFFVILNLFSVSAVNEIELDDTYVCTPASLFWFYII